MLASFCIALLFPIRSFGVLIILVGVLLSGFQQFVGINVVLYYAPEIFKTMGAATDAALLQQIVVGAVNLSFTVLAIFTVDKFGRRPLMIIGALVMAVSMLILGTTFYTRSVGMGSLVCMLVYTAGFAMSWGPVCGVLLAEIFPNSIRSTVMSIAVAAQWIANFLVSWTFPMLDKNQYLTDTFNHGMAYWIYGVMGILAALFIWTTCSWPSTAMRPLSMWSMMDSSSALLCCSFSTVSCRRVFMDCRGRRSWLSSA